MIITGLHGAARSGKDTAFSFLREWAAERGVYIVRNGFADSLKLSCYRLFKPDCTLAEALAWADDFKVRGHVWTRAAYWMPEDTLQCQMSGRELLQRFGTESHRDVFGPDFWVDQLLPRDEAQRVRRMTQFAEDPAKYPHIAVITDVRFRNEAIRIRDLGGMVWAIRREEVVGSDNHASEQPLPSSLVDVEIANRGSLEDFRRSVANTASKLVLPLLEESVYR